jgi:protein YIPF1/2
LTKFHQPNYFRVQVLGSKVSSSSSSSSGSTTHNTSDDDHTDQHPSDHAPHGKGPDLYGPIWISMTCMFLLGITANIDDYYRHVQRMNRNHHHSSNGNGNSNSSNDTQDETIDEEFEYDLTHLLNAMYISFTYTFGISSFFWLMCICFGLNNGRHPYLSWTYWVCHYGYSLVPIVIGSCLAWILPYALYHWIVLGIATSVSGLFIVRNLSTPLLEQDTGTAISMNHTDLTMNQHNPNMNHTPGATNNTHAKAAPILLSILGAHFTFLLVLKLTFYQ